MPDSTAEDSQHEPEMMWSIMSSVSISDEPQISSSPSSTPRKNHLEIAAANRARLYPDITDAQWNDWKWQQKKRVQTLEELACPFNIDEMKRERLGGVFELYRTAITPYYLCLIDFDDPKDPLRVQS